MVITLTTVTKGQSNPLAGRPICTSSVKPFYQLCSQRQFTIKPQKYTGKLRSRSWKKSLAMFPTIELAPLHHNKTPETISYNNIFISAGSFTRIREIKIKIKIIKTNRKYKPNELHFNGCPNREEACLLISSSLQHACYWNVTQLTNSTLKYLFGSFFPYKYIMSQPTKVKRSYWDSVS